MTPTTAVLICQLALAAFVCGVAAVAWITRANLIARFLITASAAIWLFSLVN